MTNSEVKQKLIEDLHSIVDELGLDGDTKSEEELVGAIVLLTSKAQKGDTKATVKLTILAYAMDTYGLL